MTATPAAAALLIRLILESGRTLTIAETPSARVSEAPQIAPGAPPLVSFRFFEGQARHRFGNMDLVVDDAGH